MATAIGTTLSATRGVTLQLENFNWVAGNISELPKERRQGGERLLAMMRKECEKLWVAFSAAGELSPFD